MNTKQTKLYYQLAEWWPLFSVPEEYAEEAEIFRQTIVAHSAISPKTLLELGSGGGNNASHLKQYFHMTLVDLSLPMLKVSRKLNPECRHIPGDMRTVRLGENFDAVFINDAIVYMTTPEKLKQAIDSAYIHCSRGGVALFVPDWTADNFKPTTSHGGYDIDDRGLRYLEWTIDHDPDDHVYISYISYLLKEKDRVIQAEMDAHVCGLFSEKLWLDLISDAGFRAEKIPFDHSDYPHGDHYIFIGHKE